METYYKPEHLTKFEEIGKEASGLAEKFFDYYNAVFAEGELTEREISHCPCRCTHRTVPLLHRCFYPGVLGEGFQFG